ncbi:MAG: tRNA dihydrouridine synthase DusB [Anaeroplasmataceae bacterium]
MGWYIKDVYIPNKLVLAPMAGITNEAFRMICKENNAGLLVAEMVSDKAIEHKNEKTLNMIKVNKLEHPISMQVFGSDVDSMVEAAVYIDKYSDADIIDINMGCPVNKVCKKKNAGAALLKDTNLVFDITNAVVKAVKKPVTVKIRIGWDFDNINAVENAKAIEKAGASAITVHGRTRSQLYSGVSDYEIIKKVKESVNIPVIANGDITSIKKAKEVLEYTKCDAIMIGRGSLGNPFIFNEVYEYLYNDKIIDRPTTNDLYNTILKHYNALLLLKGEKLAILEMRSHIGWYLKGLPNSTPVRAKINTIRNFEEIDEILKSFLLN